MKSWIVIPDGYFVKVAGSSRSWSGDVMGNVTSFSLARVCTVLKMVWSWCGAMVERESLPE